MHTYIYAYIHLYIQACIAVCRKISTALFISIQPLIVTYIISSHYYSTIGGVEGAVIHNHGEVQYIDTITNLPKYIILASDGLWDVFDIKEIIFAIDSCLENVQKVINKNNQNNNNDNYNNNNNNNNNNDNIDSCSLNNRSMSLLSSFTVTENDNDKIYNQLNAESSESFNVNDKNKCNDKNATVVNINDYNNAIKQILPNKVLEDLIRKNLINSNINLLDPILNRVAYELVQAAIKSPRWIDIGKNTYVLY